MAKQAFYIRVEARDCGARLHLNGAPVLSGDARQPWSAVAPMSEWMVDGDNLLRAEITSLGDAPKFEASLCIGELGVAPEVDNAFLSVALTIPEGVPPVLPLVLEASGKAAHPWGRWYWQDAPRILAGRRTQTDIFEFVSEIHQGLSAGDVDPLIAGCRIKFNDVGLCYDLQPPEVEAQMRQAWAGIQAQPNFALAPLDLDDLRLLLHADSRVAEPQTLEGAPLLRQLEPSEGRVWSLPLFVSRLDPVRAELMAVVR